MFNSYLEKKYKIQKNQIKKIPNDFSNKKP